MMNFAEALRACTADGKAIQRQGWNGKGQFIWFVPAGNYPARMEVIKDHFPDNLVPYGSYYALKNAQGSVVPWVPSQGDMHADDWQVTHVSTCAQSEAEVNSPEKVVVNSSLSEDYARAQERQHLADLISQLCGSLRNVTNGNTAKELNDIILKLTAKLNAII